MGYYDIQRFKRGYDKFFSCARKEILSGKKCTHWMWFIFPQVKGLGHSSISQYYGISCSKEAEEFFNDKELRKKFIALVKAVLRLKDRKAVDNCFGPIDALKLHSSMTLFFSVTEKKIFKKVIDKFYDGLPCFKTVLKLVAEDLLVERNNGQ